MKIHALFPKYSFYGWKDTDTQRIILNNVNELIDRFLNIYGVTTQYAVEDESAVKFLERVPNKQAVTFVADKKFLERYNDRYAIYPDSVWNRVKGMEPIKESSAKWKAPVKEPGQDINDWLEQRIAFCRNMCKCNMEEYLKSRGNHLLYIEESKQTNIISYHKIAAAENDGRLVIRVNINRAYSMEVYMGGIQIDPDMAVQILQTM